MGGMKRYQESLNELRNQAVQIGIESGVVGYCDHDEEAYHDTFGIDDAIDLGVEKFNNGELHGFDSPEHVKEVIESAINELGSGCSRCEHRAGD